MTLSPVVSSHVASPLFPPFSIPGRCTFTLTLGGTEGGRNGENKHEKFLGVLVIRAVASNFIVIQIYYKKECFCNFAYFRNRFQRRVCMERRIIFFYFYRFGDAPSSGVTPGAQQRNTVKETAVKTAARGGTRCTIHPCSASLSALRRLKILPALSSVGVPPRHSRYRTRTQGGTKKGAGRRQNGCEARRPEDFSGY